MGRGDNRRGHSTQPVPYSVQGTALLLQFYMATCKLVKRFHAINYFHYVHLLKLKPETTWNCAMVTSFTTNSFFHLEQLINMASVNFSQLVCQFKAPKYGNYLLKIFSLTNKFQAEKLCKYQIPEPTGSKVFSEIFKQIFCCITKMLGLLQIV